MAAATAAASAPAAASTQPGGWRCAFLAAAGGLAYTTQVSLSSDALQEYGSSFRQLSVEVTPETAHRLRVRIQPVGQQRWEVPESIVPR